MFYIRTGANGSCKTLFTLQDIRKLQLETGRPVAFNRNFKPKPILTEEFGWTLLEDVKDWELQPHGTIFLIDEAYKDFPVRPNGQQPPRYVERLAEHRSMGYDFFMLALHPSTIDTFIRKAVGAPGWHQHLKRVGGASNLTRVFQWDAVNNNCEKDGSGKSGQVSNRLQPKEVYDWYDSAFIHTGRTRIPKQVYYFVGGLVLAAVLGFFAYKQITRGVKPKEVVQGQAGVVGGPGAAPAAARPLTAGEYAAAYQPRIANLMHTAPVYDELTKPKRVPVPAACVASKSKGCRCFTQDGTPYPLDASMCASVVEHGIFLAFEAAPGVGVGGSYASVAVEKPKPIGVIPDSLAVGQSVPSKDQPVVAQTSAADLDLAQFAHKRPRL